MSRNPAAAALLLARAERELITVALDLRTASQLFPERRAELDALAAQASALGLAVAGARWRVTEPAAAVPPRPELQHEPLAERPPATSDSTPEHIRSGYCHRCTASTLHLSPLLNLCPSCLAYEQERERRDAAAGACAVCGEPVDAADDVDSRRAWGFVHDACSASGRGGQS